MTSSTNRTSTTADDGDERRPPLDLSVTKIAGGALAAVTTAFAASFLGVNGTITGAAFGSVLSSIAATVYATSLKTAGSRIRTTRTLVPAEAADPQDPAGVPPDLTGRSVPLPGETTVLPSGPPHGPEHGSGYGLPYGTIDGSPYPGTGQGPTYGASQGPAYGGTGQPPRGSEPPRRGWAPAWKPVVMLAGMVFVIALVSISATEFLLGHPVGDSKDTGTSVGTVLRGGPPAAEESEDPGESESPSPSAATSESPAPTDDASGSPTPSDSGSVAPGETTDQPSPDASPEQSQGGQDQGGQGDPSPAEPTAPAGSAAADQGAVVVP